MTPLDAIIIAADSPLEVLGKDVRERVRLTIGGVPAALPFLAEYFRAGRNADAALAALRRNGGTPFISLNGPYLSQYLTRQGLAVELIPMIETHEDELGRALARNPGAAVISTTFLPFAAQIDAIAARVKRVCPSTLVIAGGIQVWKSYRHRQLLDAGLIDDDIRPALAEHNYLMDPARPSPVDVLVVSHSGEATLAELLRRIRDGRPYSDMPNLACMREGLWRLNPIVEEPPSEPSVDWNEVLRKPVPAYVPIQAGLGCGFRCEFCDFRGLRPVRLRAPESILREIETIPPLDGIRRVYFTDDNLFSTRSRAKEVCAAIARRRAGIRWRGMIRVSVVNDEVADLMARSGCTEVLLGIESGDAQILRRMRKNVTPDQILRGVEALHRHGIHTKSTFIVGFPGETAGSVDRTVALLNAYPTHGPGVHRYLFFTFAVLPLSGTAMPESRRRYGLRGYGYEWSHATMNSREAAELMASAQDRIKLELSPNYVQEVPDVPGLTAADLKTVFLLRNRLARCQRGLAPDEREDDLWAALQRSFVSPRAPCRPSGAAGSSGRDASTV